MILAEKLSQKLHNLRSKGDIIDFFIFFDEYRNLEISLKNGKISNSENPNHYCENSEGNYVIVWNDEHISRGRINSESVNDFDEFLSLAKTTRIPHKRAVFIPNKGIYPMVITYSKVLADMIDLPEYLLKISDITDELDTMVKAKGSSCINVKEGIRYAYSSRDLDEYYPYTRFELSKNLNNRLRWQVKTSDIFSVMKFQELFSFLGDTYNIIQQSSSTDDREKDLPVILAPNVFSKLFEQQILENLNADNVIHGQSCFNVNDFAGKNKYFGTLSLSYDPLINHKLGTYKFTHYGMKPQKQYFIKFGKLNSMISDHLSFSLTGELMPSMEISSISNIKFEGIKKRSFDDIRRNREDLIFVYNDLSSHRSSSRESFIYSQESLVFQDGKTSIREGLCLKLDLIDLISNGKVEIIEFVDGQVGCRILP